MKDLLAIFTFGFLGLQIVYGDRLLAENLNDFPKLKSGGWEMTVKNEGLPAGMPEALLGEMKMHYCIDEATQDKMISQSEQQTECSPPKISRNGNTFVSDFDCTIEGQHTSTHAETTFVGDTEMINKVTATIPESPPMVMTSRARYLGACKTGMKPGDMTMIGPGGKEISLGNAEQMQQLGEELSKFKLE